ncbi:hypothetical protein GpartN1_g5389.t1 [Galdieria partita]|uniref:TFIIE beta domain-containing protein n=1 Tax=Galdieria partita TaxID=83374 RepID=A0A9C7USA4_9RHOD|nr:hypothetical protein GpartN1_g5389.t1 [Galdieria partita]
MATGEKPLGLVLLSILQYLQSELRPVSPQELKDKLHIDVEADPELKENLKTNPRILIEPDGRLRWKSKYFLRNKEDLLAVIQRNPVGIDKKDLLDAYKGVEEDLENLLHSQPPQVFCIRNNFYKQEFIFPAEPKWFYPVSDDVRQLWYEIRVPDPVDVHRHLMSRGLKRVSQENRQPESVVVRKRPQSYKARKVGRRAKLTNEHLEGTALDPNQVIENKNSPFS